MQDQQDNFMSTCIDLIDGADKGGTGSLQETKHCLQLKQQLTTWQSLSSPRKKHFFS
jgi:hypothetical protein